MPKIIASVGKRLDKRHCFCSLVFVNRRSQGHTWRNVLIKNYVTGELEMVVNYHCVVTKEKGSKGTYFQTFCVASRYKKKFLYQN